MGMGVRWFGVLAATWLAGCAEDDVGNTLEVAWVFDAGDCAAASVATVEVTWAGPDGAARMASFACEDGVGTLGSIATGGERYTIDAVGLDADGNVRAESYGQSASFSGGVPAPVEVTLHPASAELTVTWGAIAGGRACPRSVILPYHITVYEDDAGQPGTEVTSVQESCTSGEVVIEVPPGDYIVEVDSRAVTPSIVATAEVTVEAGEPATVEVGGP